MRILIATGIFPPDIGGPATYSKIIAEEFSRRGHGVHIITYNDDVISNSQEITSKKITNSKFQIRNVSRKLPKGIRHSVYFLHVLKTGYAADIIYAQDAVSAGLPASLAAFLLRKKFVLKIVGDHAWEQGMQRFGVKDLLDDFLSKKYGWRVHFLRAIQKFAAARAVCIIVPSEYLKSVVERWGIASRNINVIPNAVSVSHAVTSKEEARIQLGLGREDFVLLSVGRLVPWKGFHMLVELMPRLRAKIPNVKFVIVGDGPEKKNLESRIVNYELWKNIKLTGGVSKEHIILYLVAADVFCLNTSYEGFSHQLLEAMAAGVPVITTDAGGNKEVVKDGENALVAQYNDSARWEEKILLLYQDDALRHRLSRRNRDIADQYSVERMIAKTESIIFNS